MKTSAYLAVRLDYSIERLNYSIRVIRTTLCWKITYEIYGWSQSGIRHPLKDAKPVIFASREDAIAHAKVMDVVLSGLRKKAFS